MINKKLKVAVGMSGGVDSSMAAYLLQERGYDVSGITMLIYQGAPNESRNLRTGCYGPGEAEDIEVAKAICDKLGIPHYVIDVINDYKSQVLSNFTNEYLSGRTPNPCVLCNPLIKFGALLENCDSLGIDFDFFATGHYARIEQDPESGRYLLKKGLDAGKDQSYFLHRLNQNQLAKTIFPLGELKKAMIKEKAVKAGFADLAQKPESQDFTDRGMTGFFEGGAGEKGELVDEGGNVLGRHNGIERFTVGQRRGLNIGGSSQPLYVLAIDPQTRRVTVGPKEKLAVDRLTAMACNWIAFDAPDGEVRANAKVRSGQRETPCRFTPMENGMVSVAFDSPVTTAAPGQSVVFYQDDVVLGGGFIQSIHHVSD